VNGAILRAIMSRSSAILGRYGCAMGATNMAVSKIGALEGLGCAIAAAAFMLADVQPSHAQGMASGALALHGSAVPDGLAAMVQVRVPFGDAKLSKRDRRDRRSRRMITLTLGTSWRDQTGSPDFTGPRYVSALEAGVTFDGDPVVQLGSVDLVKTDDDKE
jgi:hypothetical protein